MRNIEKSDSASIGIANKVKDDAGLVAESMRELYRKQVAPGKIARLVGKLWRTPPKIEIFSGGSALDGVLQTSPFGNEYNGSDGSPSVAFVLEVPTQPSNADDFLRINDVMRGMNGGFINCGTATVHLQESEATPQALVGNADQIRNLSLILDQALAGLHAS